MKLDSSASSVNSNGATYLKAALKRGTKPASNFTVQLQKRTKGAASWTRIGSYKTNAEGKATNRVSGLTKNTEFRAIFAGTSTSKKSLSKIKFVTVKQQTAITAVSSSKPTSGDKVTFSGTVSPALVGKTLNLQQLKGSAWTNIATAKSTSKKTFSVTTPVSGVGSTKFRVSVSKTVDTSVAVSPQKTLTLHKWYWLDDLDGIGNGMFRGEGVIAGNHFERSILGFVYDGETEASGALWNFNSSCTTLDMYIGVDDVAYDDQFSIYMGTVDDDEVYTLGAMTVGEAAKRITRKLIDQGSLFLGASHLYGYDEGHAVFGNPRVLCAGQP